MTNLPSIQYQFDSINPNSIISNAFSMKFFIAFFLVAASIAQCLSASVQGQLLDNQQQQGLNENLEALRVRKAAYGAPAPAPSYAAPAPSYSAPPCPNNYLFSCGPHVSPVPCSSAPSGGYQGSYSENIPQYLAPQYMAPRQYAYPQYAFPVITEV
ncbi:vitelline membrane protein Vm26Aa-like [Episyrphus balteatus]|uniref:vitelline membrane protein Vm26Aa-like n=1 Tax=Episyrphus balteatus TaxID=286459 RepID=UPI002485C269|nr:vitelline membrane protein Vm26Aa-like [Episyrphus balteatus]